MNIGIIGAGPAGLACAISLARKGHAPTVFEKASGPGGLCRSFNLWDMRVDLGPHRFFSMDKKVSDFWLEPVRNEYTLIDRLTRIFYKNKFFNYPIKPIDALSKLGIGESTQCVLSYLSMRLKGNRLPEKTFAQWVSKRFGKRLYEIFFKSYSEKLWGISCDELDASFAAQRIKGLNLYEAIKNAVFPGRNMHKTLVDQFAYPDLGAGQVYDKLAAEIERLGGKIIYDMPAREVAVENGKVAGLRVQGNQEAIPFDVIVSTMPLTELAAGCQGINQDVKKAAENLRYRNTIIVYLLIDQTDIFKDNWIYVHAPDLKTGRICNFRNWSPKMHGDSQKAILALEYWANDGDELWRMDDAGLGKLAHEEILKTGLVRPGTVLSSHVERLHRSYPVYNSGYEAHLGKVQDAIDKIDNLYCIGRNGAFKYNNQDHSILMGLLAAENIADNAAHDLWRINTDYDYHEGSAESMKRSMRPAQ